MDKQREPTPPAPKPDVVDRVIRFSIWLIIWLSAANVLLWQVNVIIAMLRR